MEIHIVDRNGEQKIDAGVSSRETVDGRAKAWEWVAEVRKARVTVWKAAA